MHTPSLDALLALPADHLRLIHAFVGMIVDDAQGEGGETLHHGLNGITVPRTFHELVDSCRSLGWDTDLYQEADVPVHFYLAGSHNGLVPRVTAGLLQSWVHTEGMSAHRLLQFRSILAAIEAAVAHRRTSCTAHA